MSNGAQMEVLDRLTGIVAATLGLPPGNVDVDADMPELGIDSIIAMELIESIERAFAVSVAPAQFAAATTLRELAGLLVVPAPQPAAGAAAIPLDALREFVRRTYSLELSGDRFDSIDEVADALMADHAGDLARHYGLALQAGEVESEGGREWSGAGADGIAIIGLSCRLPDAPNARTFWSNLLAGKNSVREIPASRWRWEDHYANTPTPGKTVSKWGALLDDVDCFDAPLFGVTPAEADAMDPQMRLLLEQTWHAFEDAGLDPRSLAGSRTGVFVGYQYAEYEQYLRRFDFQRLADGPLFSSSSPTYYLANRISFAFDLRGPSEAINVNCASSAVAINRAWQALANGECDIALAAGVSLNLFAQDYIASSQYGLLSPDGTSGVFDDAACGFTRGEGVGVLVMMRTANAQCERRRIYALIKGCCQNYRGTARSLSEVRHEPIADVLASCYRSASVAAESVRYIEVDGYATKWADAFEFEGVKGALGAPSQHVPGAKRCALGSVKGNIGNVEAASGVVNVIKVALSLHHQRFPATLSTRSISRFIDIDSDTHPLYVAARAIGFDEIREAGMPVRAGVNSFADSGTNVHILLEEHGAVRSQPHAVAPAERLFVLSAREPARLADYVRHYLDFLSSDDAPGDDAPGVFDDLIYTAQTGRALFDARLAVVAASREVLRDKLAQVLSMGLREPLGLDALGIFYGASGAARANLLAGVIGPDIARVQVEQAALTGRWDAVARLWVNGVAIPWDTLWRASPAQPVTLPGYPFERQRYWIGAHDTRSAMPDAPDDSVGRDDATRGPDASGDGARPEQTPIHAIEHLLQREVARHVGRAADAVPTDQEFIELGMNSMAIARLIERIDVLLGVSVAPSTIFRHPRIDALAAHLAELATIAAPAVEPTAPLAAETTNTTNTTAAAPPVRTPASASLLVPVQTDGDVAPIFALPGAGGSALSLHQLSHALGARQPFYCIEAVGFDGKEPPMTLIEAIAGLNVALLRAMRPFGPYRLLGYSNGGVVAFEMARQLAVFGTPVSSLVLLDTLCPMLRDDDISEPTAAVFRRFASLLGASVEFDARELRQVPEHARSSYLYERIAARGVAISRAQFTARFDAATASERACRAYAPQALPFGTAVLLVRARNGFAGAPQDYGWSAFVGGALQIREIDADHFTMLDAGPAAQIAKLVGTSGSGPGGHLASEGERTVNV